MKQFTINDFIDYCNPCRICSKNVSMQIVIGNVIHSNFTVNGTKVKFTTKITYKKEDSQYIEFDAKTNRYNANFDLKSEKIRIHLTCGKCSYIISDFLEFDDAHVKPLTIFEEDFVLDVGSNHIQMITVISKNETVIYSCAKDQVNSVTSITIPLLPLSKWKNKEKLTNLIITYLTFS